MEVVKGTVCVTGGTGFIPSWLIKRLLEEGYFVRTTVRPNPGNKRDLSFLTNIVDLNDPDRFNTAIEGSKGVFHIATPVDYEYKESEEIITEREISGTLCILKACLKSETVKRVVYTSSASTVVHSGQDSDMVDESFWSDVDFFREKETPSFLSYSIFKT
ncbi:vestitone reductase-like [Hibiscus syriacus]|uniref:vestitone reductase-like n=1 Tax=Hibiscus syriacus TaxID=106335 RepID=UPI001923B13F|nr:vestitone reductase-like [Hibiscus syriacus]